MSHVTQAGVVPPLQHNCSAAQTISHSSVCLPKNQRESTSVLLLSRQEPSLRLRPARSGPEAWAACHGVTLFHTLLSTHPHSRLPNLNVCPTDSCAHWPGLRSGRTGRPA